MNKLLQLLVILIPLSGFAQGPDPVYISGMVTDIETGSPVPGHDVYITANDSMLFLTMTTNQQGMFGDTVFLNISPLSYLYIYTKDCLEQVHDTLVLLNSFEVFVAFSICTDQTGNTCDLGGFLFAGEYPINNPEHTGDTAKAILYRLINERTVPWDTLVFHELGYYWFTKVPEGRYLIKSQLMPGSSHFNTYAPTYYGNQLTWQSAVPISLDHDIYNADLQLIAFQSPADGPGSIHGTISLVMDDVNDLEASNHNIQVLLMDHATQPLHVQYTDHSGYFGFSHLGWGTYYILAEQTGMFSQPVEVILSEISPAGTVQLSLYENNVFGLDDQTEVRPYVSIRKVFPNPVMNTLRMILQVDQAMDCILQIVDQAGNIVYREDRHFTFGEHSFTLHLSSLNHGLYLITICDNNGKLIDYEKVIK